MTLATRILFRNITVWGPSANTELRDDLHSDLVFYAEAHVPLEEQADLLNCWRAAGWKPVATPARQSQVTNTIRAGGVVGGARNALAATSFRHLANETGQLQGLTTPRLRRMALSNQHQNLVLNQKVKMHQFLRLTASPLNSCKMLYGVLFARCTIPTWPRLRGVAYPLQSGAALRFGSTLIRALSLELDMESGSPTSSRSTAASTT